MKFALVLIIFTCGISAVPLSFATAGAFVRGEPPNICDATVFRSVATKEVVEGKCVVDSLDVGTNLFGVNFTDVQIAGKKVSFQKGSLYIFGRKYVLPPSSKVKAGANDIEMWFNSLNLTFVVLTRTSVRMTAGEKSPFSLLVVGEISWPIKIKYDCFFPLQSKSSAPPIKLHPTIKVSSDVSYLTLGDAQFGATMTGIDVHLTYVNGAVSQILHVETTQAKIFGSQIILNEGRFPYSSNEIIMHVPHLELQHLTLHKGELRFSPKDIKYASSFNFRGRTVAYQVVYNTTKGTIRSDLKTEGVQFKFAVKKGSFVSGKIQFTPRSLAIEYSANSVKFRMESKMEVKLLGLTVKFDPVILCLPYMGVAARTESCNIFGTTPKIEVNINHDAHHNTQTTTLEVTMTAQTTKQILTGFLMANSKLIQKGCEHKSPTNAHCAQIGKAVDYMVTQVSNLVSLNPGNIVLKVCNTNASIDTAATVGDSMVSAFLFAKYMRGAVYRLKTESDFSEPGKEMSLILSFPKHDQTIWFEKKTYFSIGVNSMDILAKFLPDIIHKYSGVVNLRISRLFEPHLQDVWELELNGTMQNSTSANSNSAVRYDIFFETLHPVNNAFGIQHFRLNQIKISLQFISSPIALTSLEFTLQADMGSIKGLEVFGTLNLQNSLNYFFFYVDKLKLRELVGAVVGKAISAWPASVDPQLNKTRVYLAWSRVTVTQDHKTIELGHGLNFVTRIAFLGSSAVVHAGLTNSTIFFIKEFEKICDASFYDDFGLLVQKIADTAVSTLDWPSLTAALKKSGQTLSKMFKIKSVSFAEFQFDTAKPLEVKLPSIRLGFVFAEKKVEIELASSGLLAGLDSFPNLFSTAIKKFGGCNKWIKTLGLNPNPKRKRRRKRKKRWRRKSKKN